MFRRSRELKRQKDRGEEEEEGEKSKRIRKKGIENEIAAEEAHVRESRFSFSILERIVDFLRLFPSFQVHRCPIPPSLNRTLVLENGRY